MNAPLKYLASKFPEGLQTELKRIYFRFQIWFGRFTPDEPEYPLLPNFLLPGDWAIDIGANVGHYSKRLSELVGPTGRVLSFEPVPVTFSLLASNAQLFAFPNVTLINAGASNRTVLFGIECPSFATGLTNYYEARMTESVDSPISSLALALDSLNLPHKIALVKIDTEGHEQFVIDGLEQIIRRDKPVLIVETADEITISKIVSFNYSHRRLPGSPNILFEPK